ncbi:morphogenetic protein, partial [Salmonella enterica]|nr:morphogenetic protein [Salmonella enterica]
MLLPLFPLPSRPTELIQFRQPNIADAMRFNSITPEEQEQQTTAYLKALLAEPAKYDPLTWTAQDRITALWWIFTGSRETPVETFTYTCKHCG